MKLGPIELGKKFDVELKKDDGICIIISDGLLHFMKSGALSPDYQFVLKLKSRGVWEKEKKSFLEGKLTFIKKRNEGGQ